MKKKIIIENIHTEKSSSLFLKNNTYSFYLLENLNKIEILKKITQKYSVKIKKINILNSKKFKKRGSRFKSFSFKKVYLTLEDGFSFPNNEVLL